MITILLILALLDPHLTARWDRPGVATVAWDTRARDRAGGGRGAD